MIISQKPYLIRAIYEWCEDNGFLPYLATMVNEKTSVPVQYVEDSRIVLNIARSATKDLLIDNEWITFRATFGGIAQDVAIQIGNVIAVFAKENGQGMQFQVEVTTDKSEKPNKGLKLVK
jgi:stringent starvation protein B